MAQRAQSTRVRYPARAILAVLGASVAFLFNLIVGFLFMALVPPMIPIYVCVLFSGACLLGNAVAYAQRASVRTSVAMLEVASHEESISKRAWSSPAA